MIDHKVDTAALLAEIDIVKVIDGLVPLKKSGGEYEACCPFHNEATPSFKVSPAKQIYHCFGCGANGDAIKFLQEFQGLSFHDACRALGADVPVGTAPCAAHNPPAAVRRAPLTEKKAASVWRPIMPVPAQASPPPAAHPVRGLPERVWCYRSADGAALGYIYRFRTSTGGKETLPMVWAQAETTGRQEWRWLSFAEPRPLYGLDRLAARPDATVLVVEGEKCADAGAAELPDYVVVSWPGGGKAVKKADFAPLAGRKVILWADCDAKRYRLSPAEQAAGVAQESKPLLPAAEQPGVKAMAEVAAILQAQACEVSVLRIPEPGERPDGWDIADAVAEGLAGAALAEFIARNCQPLAAASKGGEAPPEPASSAPAESISPAKPATADRLVTGEVLPWASMLLRKGNGDLVDCRENVFLVLDTHPEWRGKIVRDEFANKVIKRVGCPIGGAGGEWNDDDNLRLGLWLAQNLRLIVKQAGSLHDGVVHASANHAFHPVRNWLRTLVWDGTPRLDDWLSDFLGLKKSEYSMLSGRLILIALVARVEQPGCIMRQMPVLEGGQYVGKSTALRILGGPWFADTPFRVGDKDAYQVLRGKWVFEIAELDAFNRSEATAMKAFVSSPVDTYRGSYERTARDWARQTVFFGTTNQDEYFKDSTGNSRYVPWRVEQVEPIDLAGLEATRDQLFAEAFVRYQRGERWHPSRDEQRRLFDPVQEQREIPEIWLELLETGLAQSTANRVSMGDLIEILKIDPAKIDNARGMSTRIGMCMRKLGWQVDRDNSESRKRLYMRPPVVGSKGLGNDPF